MKKEDSMNESLVLSRALRDVILDAEPSSLKEALSELNVDSSKLAEEGKTAAARALQLSALSNVKERSAIETAGIYRLHDALSTLLQLLRRRDNLSQDELADRARVEVDEIRRIEHDRTYTARPRTIYQLERAFNLPPRTLVRLSGLKTAHSREFTEEALKFAAHSKAIHKMTRDEKRLLSEFVKFLASHTDSNPEE